MTTKNNKTKKLTMKYNIVLLLAKFFFGMICKYTRKPARLHMTTKLKAERTFSRSYL